MAWVDSITEGIADGVILNSDPGQDGSQPRWGERAAQIRQLAVRYPELSKSDIAKRVGCNPDNVRQVLARFLGPATELEMRDFQANKADVYDAVAHRSLISITPEHFAKASALQLVTMAAILEDKARLVRGQATSISVNALLDVAQLIREGKA